MDSWATRVAHAPSPAQPDGEEPTYRALLEPPPARAAARPLEALDIATAAVSDGLLTAEQDALLAAFMLDASADEAAMKAPASALLVIPPPRTCPIADSSCDDDAAADNDESETENHAHAEPWAEPVGPPAHASNVGEVDSSDDESPRTIPAMRRLDMVTRYRTENSVPLEDSGSLNDDIVRPFSLDDDFDYDRVLLSLKI